MKKLILIETKEDIMEKVKKILILVSCFLFLLIFHNMSFATTLSVDLTVDNGFSLYISTDDNVVGTFVDTGDYWPIDHHYDITLTPDVTNYLHIMATDWGGIAGLIGDLSLSDSDFYFANGTQSLLSNTTDWQVYTDNFGGTLGTLTIVNGTNGVPPWGTFPNIDSAAAWIWTNYGYDINTTLYFSTPIYDPPPAAVPEPSTLLLLGSGLLGLGYFMRKKRRG